MKLNEDSFDSGRIIKMCMNPECNDIPHLRDCLIKKPIIRLGKRCWNCKKSDYLVDYDEAPGK